MRVFGLSDLHVDYLENAAWVERLSRLEYQQDVLLLAGDISDLPSRLRWGLEQLVKRFRRVLFVPGNHEFWVLREAGPFEDSLKKFSSVQAMALECGASIKGFRAGQVWLVPLLGWYDYSFGEPTPELAASWMDFRACRWPWPLDDVSMAEHFERLNSDALCRPGDQVITFSHFLPRVDLMPAYLPSRHKMLFPVLGSSRLERQLRRLGSSLHLYGHSHLNRNLLVDGVRYVNNALGYPSESAISSRRLLCLYES